MLTLEMSFMMMVDQVDVFVQMAVLEITLTQVA
jgi:hypothetical protein